MSIVSTYQLIKQSPFGGFTCGLCKKGLTTFRQSHCHFAWQHDDIYQDNKAEILEQLRVLFHTPAGSPMTALASSILIKEDSNK